MSTTIGCRLEAEGCRKTGIEGCPSGYSLQPSVCDEPFRHVIIDHWAEPELVRAAEAEWPDERWPFWHRYDCGKLATKDPLRFPPVCAELIRRMLYLRVGELLGVDEAFGDWTCHAAGLHAMPAGSSLGLHLDSDHHPQTGWRRAANAVLYLNRSWEPDWGGELELCSGERDKCSVRSHILPAAVSTSGPQETTLADRSRA